jgi:ammonia channel protein AmtB
MYCPCLVSRSREDDPAIAIDITRLERIMIPGLGYLYSGLVRRKNALTLLLMTMLATACISFQVSSTRYNPRSSGFHFFADTSRLVVVLGLQLGPFSDSR